MPEKPSCTDRTRIEATYDCARKRFWGWEYGGWGLSPEGEGSEDLLYGIAYHEGAEILAKGGTLDDALKAAYRSCDKIGGVTIDGLGKDKEYRALAYGHLRTLHESILPELREQYDIVGVETEIALPLADDLLDLTRLDVAFRDKKTKENYYVEWKTSSDPSKIREEMEYNIQFVLNVEALARALKEPVVGTIIVGVDKGRKGWPSETEKKAGLSGNRRESPFTYAYLCDDGWTKEWSLKWKKYWKKVPTFNVMPAEEWYQQLGTIAPGVAKEQFTVPPPIVWDQNDFERTKRQVVAMEKRVATATTSLASSEAAGMAAILDEHFPMNRKNCLQDGGFRGHRCPFIDLCHGAAAQDPLSWGYKWRETNHPLEETLREKPKMEDKDAEV